MTRRSALAAVGVAGFGATGLVAANAAEEPAANRLTAEQVHAYYTAMKPSRSCGLLARTIDDTKANAQVVGGFVNNTYFLIVAGKKPFLNMTVTLIPLVYVMQPDYWEIEVVGCTPGIVLPAIGSYHETLSIDSFRGKKGIEVVWADSRERIEVP